MEPIIPNNRFHEYIFMNVNHCTLLTFVRILNLVMWGFLFIRALLSLEACAVFCRETQLFFPWCILICPEDASACYITWSWEDKPMDVEANLKVAFLKFIDLGLSVSFEMIKRCSGNMQILTNDWIWRRHWAGKPQLCIIVLSSIAVAHRQEHPLDSYTNTLMSSSELIFVKSHEPSILGHYAKQSTGGHMALL